MSSRRARAPGVGRRLLACGLLLACGQPANAPDPPPEGAGADAISLVLLISLDTLRADHLGIYGYERPTSPRLDALARRGVRFLDASSTSTWTLPAHASLLTGRYVDRHGVRTEGQWLRGDVPTLAGALAEAGWETAAVVNSFYLSERFGLQRGFERKVYVEESAARVAPSTWVTDQAIAWIDDQDEEPLFLFLHYYDIHSDYAALPRHRQLFEGPYRGPARGTTEQLVAVQRGDTSLEPADARHLVDLYDAGIHQTDAELGRLFDALAVRDRWPRALVVVTSDHGEEFLEHGGVLHGRTQFQELLRVPLLVVGPGIPAALRIDQPVSLVDVAPTLLDLLGVPAPDGMQGVSLQPLWSGRGPAPARDRLLFSESRHGLEEPVDTWAARSGTLKRVVRADGSSAVYDLATDPDERSPLPAGEPPGGERLERALADFRRRVEERPEGPGAALRPEERAHLRALGYLQESEAAEPRDEEPDAGPAPRRR